MKQRNDASRPMGLALYLLLALPTLVFALCECGYSVKDPNDETQIWVFTDLLESDFTTTQATMQNPDWVRQEFNVSADAGRGLGLRVGNIVSNDAVPVAEADSARLDLHWGSYRAGMKATSVNGTCAAFFWYFNDTQEIDMEFLSREFEPINSIYPISLVIQTPESKEAGYDASKTGTYQRVNLTFDPTADFHEYRFDYVEGRVLFYADSKILAEMEGNRAPSVGGHLILQHWSNGNPLWSGGPPERDALMTVNYVKAYFNSSDSERLSERVEKCYAAGTTDGAVCAIPDVTAADVSTGGHFFGAAEDEEGGNREGDDTSDDERKEHNEHEDSSSSVMWKVSIALVVVVSMAMCSSQV